MSNGDTWVAHFGRLSQPAFRYGPSFFALLFLFVMSTARAAALPDRGAQMDDPPSCSTCTTTSPPPSSPPPQQ